MNILVFNCGSSSLKYKLIAMPSEEELAGGEAQRVGPQTAEPSRIVHRRNGRETSRVIDMPDHESAFREIVNLLSDDRDLMPHAMGHRMVHGGSAFTAHSVVDDCAMLKLEEIQDLAPIHNPPATSLLGTCRRLHPDVPQVVVFDTAFHTTIPEHAYTYAIPGHIREQLGIRKYGFHGTSHQYVVSEAARILEKPPERVTAVSCHLGSGGASLCAIANGCSVDNTMGYSPLQGLVMSTRSGDLDPSITLNLLARCQGDTSSVSRLLNKKSGVLGLSGFSGDIRDVMRKIESGKGDLARFKLATQVYLWRIRKYLGAYLAVIGRADAVIFTDTIGETMPEVRWAVCTDMEAFGVKIEASRNQPTSLPADVAADDSPVRILVIATNEELAIARQTYRVLHSGNREEARR